MLRGKTVNISKERLGLLSVFYPDFVVREILFFDQDNKVIYTGKDRKDLIEYLTNNTKEFINTTGPYEYDLENKEVLLELVYRKWGKEPREDLKNAIINLPDDDFYGFVKRRWVLPSGEPLEKAKITIYDLYKVFGKSKTEAMNVFFELVESYPPVVVESSLLTFLEKVVTLEDISVSPHYLKLLKDFKQRHGDKIKKVLFDYKNIDYSKEEMNVLWLILQF